MAARTLGMIGFDAAPTGGLFRRHEVHGAQHRAAQALAVPACGAAAVRPQEGLGGTDDRQAAERAPDEVLGLPTLPPDAVAVLVRKRRHRFASLCWSMMRRIRSDTVMPRRFASAASHLSCASVSLIVWCFFAAMPWDNKPTSWARQGDGLPFRLHTV